MKTIRAISYGRPATWGRCFSLEKKAGLFDVGERVRATLADEAGLVWSGVAECFGVTERGKRAIYDFEKVGDAAWLKQGGNYA